MAAVVYAAAKKMALVLAAELHLFRAVALPPEIPAAAHNEADPTDAIVQQNIHTELAKLAGEDSNVVTEKVVVSAASPWRLILSTAQSIDADLIVLGSHGYAGWDRILGTTAAQVCNRSDRNVLVVHKGL